MTKEEVEEIINEWPKEWCVPVSEDQLRQEEEELKEENLDKGNEEEDPSEDVDSAEIHSPSIPTDHDT